MQSALASIEHRHPVLRSSVTPNPAWSKSEWDEKFSQYERTHLSPGGLYVHMIQMPQRSAIDCYDISHLDGPTQATALRQIYQETLAPKIKSDGTLGLQAIVIRTSPETHLLLVSMDHLFSDAWSRNVLRREIVEHYGEEGSSDRRQHFLDYADWEQKALETTHFDADIDYWTDHWRRYGSARIAAEDIPFFWSSSSGMPDPRLEAETFDPAATAKVRAAARQLRTSPYVIFLVSCLIVLRHYLARNVLAIWCNCANRASLESQSMIGYLVNTQLMGFDIADDMRATEVLDLAGTRLKETMQHEQLPLYHLWRVLRCHPAKPDSGFLLDWRPDAPNQWQSENGVVFEHASLIELAPPRRASLRIQVFDRRDDLVMVADYPGGQYPSEAMKQLLVDIRTTVFRIIDRPESTVADFASLTGRYRSAVSRPHAGMNEFTLVDSCHIPARS
jgi:hypothetical protein